MPNSLHNLPAEVLINVLSYLPGIDLESCKLINRNVRDTISNSVLLRYLIAVDLAGVEDNPQCELSLPEKFTMLMDRELSWRKFEPNFTRSISVDHPTSGIYDLTDGVYILGALNRPWLHHLELPTLSSQVPTWLRLDSDLTIVDIALAIYESDLVAIITSSSTPIPNPHGFFRIELNFRSFKNAGVHPLARQPTILVGFTSRIPSISIEVVGDFVALAVTRHDDLQRLNDQVSVWNWKTGTSLISIDVTRGAYPSVLFLTGDILLLPNVLAATFEFWKIPSSPDENTSIGPAYVIDLPPLGPGMQISKISCRGEPNPLGPRSTLNFNRPFRASPQQAIIIFHIHIDSFSMGSRFSLTLVVHRRSLVDLIDKHSSQISPEGIWQPLPWTEWGPSSTRWFFSNRMSTQWITTSAGQRFASIPSTAAQTPAPILIYDFNPYNVVRMKNYLKHRRPNRYMFWSEREEELEDVPTVFAGSVRSALPYCCYKTKGLHSYNGVLMDEETLLGIKTGAFGVESVDIMHFG